MFNFAELETCNELGYRFYKTPTGNFYPSITSILGATVSEEKQESLKRWQNSLGKNKASELTQQAANRGTNVHLLIERLLKGEDLQLSSFSQADVNSFNALRLKLKGIEEVWGQEISLYSDTLEVAGRCDCIAVYRGVPSIIDYKTATRIKTEKEIADYKLQCAFYSIGFLEQFEIEITQGVILMTSAGGFPQEFKFSLPEQYPLLITRVEEFYEKLNKKIGLHA